LRVVVETSVWSLSLRRGGPADHPAVRKLAILLRANEDVVLIGLILQEVLQGFREDRPFQQVAARLEAFQLLELRRSEVLAAARLHRRCAAEGVSASTADCQIAAAAIRHDCWLLTADADFGRIARRSRLKLA